jgi:hypothetical protein
LPQEPEPLQLPVLQVAVGHSDQRSSEEVWLAQAPLAHFWQVPQLEPPPSEPWEPSARLAQAPAPSQLPVLQVAVAQSPSGSVPEVVFVQDPDPLQVLQTLEQ